MSRRYSRDMKLRALARIQEGETKASVARELNVPESTIRGWCKSKKLQEQGQNMYPRLTARHDFNEMMQMRQQISLAASQDEKRAVHRTYKQDKKEISYTQANQVGNSSIMDDEQIVHPINIAVKKEPMDEDIDLEEALDHGKKYLQWLETCGHPSVTMMHVESIRLLLNNLKARK
nr:protein distal antenna-like [Leptinotarsa decemlineata]